MKTICVCGAGTMGLGIAQLCALGGYPTILFEINETILAQAITKLKNEVHLLVEKKRMTLSSKQMLFEQLSFTSNLQECVGEIIIEAIIENEQAKIDLLSQLVRINNIDTVFASNTSSLSISRLGAKTSVAHRFAGLHFFNPARIMKLVEVVRGKETTETTIQILLDFARNLGKHPVVCADAPGFIVNRVARPYYIESLRLVEQGIANFEIIDKLLEDKGFKLGPFKLMDLIGNDINYAVSCSIYEQLGKPERLKPSYIQKQKVENGELGKKTAKGYYEY